MRLSKINWLLIAIFVLGLVLRIWGINFGLPYMYHPDEGVPVRIALRIIQTGNLHPQFFNWPSLLMYLNALLYFGFFVVGRVLGRFSTTADLPFPDMEAVAVGKAAMPEEFLLSRGLTALVGALTIFGIYFVVRQMKLDRWVAWLAALLLAVESVNVWNSHLIRPDIFVVFCELVSVLFSLKIVDDPRFRNYALAALGAGLATSFKYTAVFIFFPILAAHLVRYGTRGLYRKEIYLALAICILSFLATTPFAILDPERFLRLGPLDLFGFYSAGVAGAEGNTVQWYLSLLWQKLWWILPLAVLDMALILRNREEKGLALLSFVVAYYILINAFTTHSDSNVMPVIPFLIIFASEFVFRVYTFLSQRWSSHRLGYDAAMVGVAFFLTVPSLQLALADDARLLQVDGREQARVWISQNLPLGARIALEPYSPYLDRKQFVVEGFSSMTGHALEWYSQNGFEYLVLSSGTYQRFYSDPVRYADFVKRYDEFSKLPEVARFNANGFEIRILNTGVAALPSHRVATRFGDYSDLIELVGYDQLTPKAFPGDSINIKFYWRPLRQANEPLELVMRLLGLNDREIYGARGDLFQGQYPSDNWPAGIFTTDWKIPTKPEVAPGQYRLQVSVVQSKFAYQAPIANWADEKIEQLFLGPLKLSVLQPSPSELQAASPLNLRWNSAPENPGSDQIELLSYRTMGAMARAGDSYSLTLYWRVLAKPTKDYTVFIHLLSKDGKVVGQVDSQPRGGLYPVSIWEVGEIVRDDYVLPLSNDLAPGDYQIELGVYDSSRQKRMLSFDSRGKNLGDHLILPVILQVVR